MERDHIPLVFLGSLWLPMGFFGFFFSRKKATLGKGGHFWDIHGGIRDFGSMGRSTDRVWTFSVIFEVL